MRRRNFFLHQLISIYLNINSKHNIDNLLTELTSSKTSLYINGYWQKKTYIKEN